MKIKDGFVKREIAGTVIVVPVGKNVRDFNGMITLNETSSFLWDCMSESTTKDEVLKKLTGAYDVEPEKAVRDIDAFIRQLSENGLLEE